MSNRRESIEFIVTLKYWNKPMHDNLKKEEGTRYKDKLLNHANLKLD